MKSLHPHQTLAHDGLRGGFRRGHRRGLLVLPTGAGKTVTALEMLRLAVAQGRRGLFLCDRRQLVLQAAREGRDYGLPCGVLMAQAPAFRRPEAPIQFASKDTLLSWYADPSYELPPADLVITDEAHRSAADTWKALLAAYPRAWEVGLTATAARSDARGLGDRYEFLVQPTGYQALIAAGVLAPAVCYAPGDKVVKGRKRPTRKGMVGDVVGWWQRLAAGLRTFVFASSIAHSLALVADFQAAGVSAVHLDGSTPDDERDQVLGREGSLARGDVQVVCSCSVLKYGVDVPSVECVQIADGFGSLVDYLQAVGRGLRASPGKKHCLVIDHSGCVLYHGFPDADREWVLDGDTDHDQEYRAGMKGHKKPKPVVCPKCYGLFAGRPDCPHCGHRMIGKALAEAVGPGKGTLYRVEGEGVLGAEDYSRGWVACVAVAKSRGVPLGVALTMFRRKYGRKPWECGAEPLPDRGRWQVPAVEFWNERIARTITV